MQLVREATLAGGRYRLLEARGVGGMATVWRAIDERLERPVAVKVMSDALAVDEDYVVRFHREARIAAGLSHPNLVRLFDFGAEDDRPFLVSEWIDGPDLLELHREGPAEVDAERLLWNLLEALEHIHGEGILHRDVKPSNILIDRNGEARLTDFGIAQPEDATRLTQTGLVMGTAPFIAPEVLAGEPSTRRSDLYAVGTVIRYVTGGAISPRLAEIVSQLTADDPRARPTSATAALEFSPDPFGSEPPATPPPARLPRETPPPAPPSLPPSPDHDARSLLPFGIGLGVIALGAIVLALLASGSKPAGNAAKPPPSPSGEQTSTPSSTTAAQTTAPEAPPPPAAPAGVLPKPKPKPDPAKGAELNDEGFALIGEGKYDEAVKKLEEAVSLFPSGTTDLNYAYALYNLGHALRLAGRPDEAIPVLEQRMQIPDQLPTVQQELDLARQEASGAPDEGD